MNSATEAVFREALEVTGKGMAALFAFMLVFFVILVLLDRIFPGRNDEAGNQVL